MYAQKTIIFLFFSILLCCSHIFGNEARELELVEHVKKCIILAEKKKSLLTSDVMAVNGFTGEKIKHFLNNVCSLANTSYLEIGCWKGATFTAALYKNEPSLRYAVAVDNWSEFNGPKDEFFKNTAKFLSHGCYHFFEKNSFSINLQTSFPIPINIYFYDGGHSTLEQERAFTYFNDIFEDVFIAIVDDWNWMRVREGTASAFSKLNYQILFEKVLFTDKCGDPENWWNGFYIAVIKKDGK